MLNDSMERAMRWLGRVGHFMRELLLRGHVFFAVGPSRKLDVVLCKLVSVYTRAGEA
jgi:hypothetical protein